MVAVQNERSRYDAPISPPSYTRAISFVDEWIVEKCTTLSSITNGSMTLEMLIRIITFHGTIRPCLLQVYDPLLFHVSIQLLNPFHSPTTSRASMIPTSSTVASLGELSNCHPLLSISSSHFAGATTVNTGKISNENKGYCRIRGRASEMKCLYIYTPLADTSKSFPP